ncbi:MAG: ERCC4 domain-containing protein [Nitrososphaerota archaeon]
MALIIADSRETKAVHHIPIVLSEYQHKYPEKIDYAVERLEVGDYVIKVQGKVKAIIERKTWSDLAASIKDGRMNNQEERLSSLRTRCKVLYIIEGRNYNNNHIINGISFRNLNNKIRHNLLRGIPFLRTYNILHTAYLLADLARDYLLIKSPRSGLYNDLQNILIEYEEEKDSELYKKISSILDKSIIGNQERELELEIKKPKSLNDRDVVSRMWQAINGIGIEASIILMKNLTLREILCDDINDVKEKIKKLRFQSGKIFGSRADKIVNNARNENTWISILSSIPRISRTTAKIILKRFSLPDIASGKILLDDLAEVQKKRGRVGKMSSKIFEYLNTFFSD